MKVYTLLILGLLLFLSAGKAHSQYQCSTLFAGIEFQRSDFALLKTETKPLQKLFSIFKLTKTKEPEIIEKIPVKLLDLENPIKTEIKYPDIKIQKEYVNEIHDDPVMYAYAIKNPNELEAHRLKIWNDRFYNSRGNLIGVYSPETFIYVMDTRGNIYIAHFSYQEFHHNSFGVEVAAAGEITIHMGKIPLMKYKGKILSTVDTRSGHYKPSKFHLDRFVKELTEKVSPEHKENILKGLEWR